MLWVLGQKLFLFLVGLVLLEVDPAEFGWSLLERTVHLAEFACPRRVYYPGGSVVGVSQPGRLPFVVVVLPHSPMMDRCHRVVSLGHV